MGRQFLPVPTTFSRSMRSLEADGFRRSLWGILTVIGLLSACAGWFFLARIDLYEVSNQARLEVDQEVHPIAAWVAGRITSNGLVLGRKVREGEVLVELESEGERLRVEEERARLAALPARLESLRNETAAEEQAWAEERKTARLTSDEARARQREAETAASFALLEANRYQELDKTGTVSKSDSQRADAEAGQRRASASAFLLSVGKLESEELSKEKNHQARLAKLKSEAVLLEGEVTTTRACLKRWEYEIEKRRIHAPVSGEIAEVANVRVGSFVDEGDKFGAIVPPGALRVVAHFDPWSALGRIRAGQPSRLRLDGFPWAQYGTVSATVTKVANEPRAGSIRVEFAVIPNSHSLIPLQHGLPGTIEVKVDRVSPAELVLRAAGKLLAMPGSGFGGTAGRQTAQR